MVTIYCFAEQLEEMYCAGCTGELEEMQLGTETGDQRMSHIYFALLHQYFPD